MKGGQWAPVTLLGLATIGAYGTAYYSIGVLIPGIAADMGWSTGLLSVAFSLGVVGQAAFALLVGQLLDRLGSRAVLLPSAVAGAALLFLSSFAESGWQFISLWALGGTVVGGGLYYNVSMPLTARLYPERRATAFSILTLLGALASPIFYPLAGWLVEAFGWREAVQALTVLMFLCVVPAGIVVRTPAVGHAPSKNKRLREQTLFQPAIQRLFIVLALVGAANSSLVLHQAPAMQAAGLSLAAASAFAGARGAFQIPGRLLLSPLTSRLGVRGTILACYAVAGTASLALLVAVSTGSAIFIAYFTVAGGISLGLLSPLNGLFQAEVFGDERLGALSGIAVAVASLATAAGAILSGALVDLTGSYEAPLSLAWICFMGAILAMLWQGQRTSSQSAASERKVADSSR